MSKNNNLLPILGVLSFLIIGFIAIGILFWGWGLYSLHSFDGMNSMYCCGLCDLSVGKGDTYQVVLPTSSHCAVNTGLCNDNFQPEFFFTCPTGALEWYDPSSADVLDVTVKIDGVIVHSGTSNNGWTSSDKTNHFYYAPLLSSTLSCGEHSYFVSITYDAAHTGWNEEKSGTWCIEDDSCVGACTIKPPGKPVSTGFKALLVKIGAWFNSLLDKLRSVLPFSIVGAEDVQPGNTETYEVELVAPTLIDSSYEDGKMQVRYCNVGLIDKNGDVLLEKGVEACFDTYTTSFTIIVPSNPGSYAVVSVMTEFNGVYDVDTKGWVWGEEEVIQKEALSLVSKAPIPGLPSPNPLASIINFFTNIWNWIVNLFG